MFKIVLEPVQSAEMVWKKQGKKGNRNWWIGSVSTRTFLEIIEVLRSCNEIYTSFCFGKQLKNCACNQR